MANYAHVENNQIQGVYSDLPKNWRNISNFFALTDWNYLNSLGWYEIIKLVPQYDPTTHKIDNASHYIENDNVYETYELIALPPPPTQTEINDQKWEEIRAERDQLMKDFEWRYIRYDRQVRMNILTSDDLQLLDEYMQALADITLQPDPFSIEWPTFNGA